MKDKLSLVQVQLHFIMETNVLLAIFQNIGIMTIKFVNHVHSTNTMTQLLNTVDHVMRDMSLIWLVTLV